MKKPQLHEPNLQMDKDWAKYVKQQLKWRKQLEKELAKEPNHHWNLNALAVTYLATEEYNTALFYNNQALELAPRCPVSRWDQATIMVALGEYEAAIHVWKGLIRDGVKRLTKTYNCNEGIRWTKALLNDARYEIASAYYEMAGLGSAKEDECFVNAVRYMTLYLKNRSNSTGKFGSMYERKEAETKLAEMIEARD